MYLSIIIPAYNEAKRIKLTLSKIDEFLCSKKYVYELILVDDGSTDKTIDEALRSRLDNSKNLRIIKNDINRGKGYSVKTGILNSRGEFLLISDADLSTPIQELDKLFHYMSNGYDIVIGSRSVEDSDVQIHQRWYREKMGKVFNIFVKFLLLSNFNDTQCGFKLIKGKVARNLALLMKIQGFCFDVELLYLAKKKGYRIKEIGVIWRNSPQSRVKIISSSSSMFLDLFKIRFRHK